ncbi:hypothetical protein [Novosphingobium sp. BL-52-GroH]|uniref:hypothetical protein n=1 Tax=Novosphingobium sp. BL-52-GroH TaxID=3349877 RepID=UPI00384C7C42
MAVAATNRHNPNGFRQIDIAPLDFIENGLFKIVQVFTVFDFVLGVDQLFVGHMFGLHHPRSFDTGSVVISRTSLAGNTPKRVPAI